MGTIADLYKVGRDQVIVGTGSGPILEGATRAFCSAQKPLVTAAPTYGTPDQAARRIGAEVKFIRVDRSMGLDLDAMAEAAKGAGMVFFCNPNNPTGTVHNAAAVERFVRRVKQSSPDTRILIDEAYIDYVHDVNVKTTVPLARDIPGVFVTRSFSKAHGMAGLRLGYAIGQPDTVRAISNAWSLGSVNTLTAAAGIASLMDPQRLERPRSRLHVAGVSQSRIRGGGLPHELHLRGSQAAREGVSRCLRRAQGSGRARFPAFREHPLADHAGHDGRNAAGSRGVQESAHERVDGRRRAIT